MIMDLKTECKKSVLKNLVATDKEFKSVYDNVIKVSKDLYSAIERGNVCRYTMFIPFESNDFKKEYIEQVFEDELLEFEEKASRYGTYYILSIKGV